MSKMKMRGIFLAVVVATILLGNGISCVQGKEFVLVHGAGHGAWCWYKVATILQEAGYKTTTLDMTAAGTRDKTSADAVTSVAQHTKPLVDYLATVSGQVVLVGHSIGGISISYAMEQYPNKISHAIFLSAMMPANNNSLLTSVPPTLLPDLSGKQVFFPNFANGANAPPTSISFNLTIAPQYFYNLSPATDITLALTLLNNEPYVLLSEVLSLTPAKYGSVRRFYLETTQDNLWGPTGQKFVINNNPPERSFRINGSDHSAFFSKPIATAAYLVLISDL